MDFTVLIAMSFVSLCWTVILLEFHIYFVKLREWRWLMSMADENCCMCGSDMRDHDFSHSPVSELEYYRKKRPKFE